MVKPWHLVVASLSTLFPPLAALIAADMLTTGGKHLEGVAERLEGRFEPPSAQYEADVNKYRNQKGRI